MRWEQPRVRYVPITGVSSTAPVVITAVGHDMPDGWRFAVSGLKGAGFAISSKHAPPKRDDFFKGTVLTPDTIEINAVNGAAWPAYVSGGILQFNLPVDLSSVVAAKLHVRRTVDDPVVLIELTHTVGITIDDASGTTTCEFSPESTSELPADITDAVFDMELVFADGTVMAYPVTPVLFTGECTK